MIEAITTAATAVRDWLIANLPQSNKHLVERMVNADGTITDATLSSAETAGLRAELQTVVDAIDP